MSETRTETEVIYFPLGSFGQKARKAKDMADARRICAELKECSPLIQQRTVTTSEWLIVENPSMFLADAGVVEARAVE